MAINPANLFNRSRWDAKVKYRVDAGDENLLDEPGTLLLPMQRDRLLRYLPAKARIAEIGVARGHFSAQLKAVCKPSFLALVDPWKEQDSEIYYGDSNNAAQGEQDRRYEAVRRRFESSRRGQECRVLRMYSANAVREFPDRHFDWVFIDANHSYEACLEDLRLWADKVTDDGLLCGHDYAAHASAREAKYGVVEAVRDFIKETGYGLAALTSEQFPTYVVAKNPKGATVRRMRDLICSYEPHVIQVSDASRAGFRHARLLGTDKPRAAYLSFEFSKR